MAILESATLDIPLSGGLAEKVDKRVLPPGSYAVLENLVQDKAGAFKKRYGFGAVAATVGSGPAVVESPANLGAFRGEPWAISDPEEAPPGLYQRDGAAWQLRAEYEFARTLFRREVVRPAGTSFFESIHRVATAPRARVVTLWVESDTSVTVPAPGDLLYRRVIDAATGLEVFPRAQASALGTPVATCVIGTRVLFVQRNAIGAFVVASVDAATGAVAAVVTITPAGASSAAAVDIAPYDATNFLIAYRDGNNTVLQIRNATTGVAGASVTVAGPVASSLVSLAFLAGSPGSVWVFARPTVGVVNAFSATSSGPTNLTIAAALAALPSAVAGAQRIAPAGFVLAGTGPACLVAISDAAMTELRLVDENLVPFVATTVPWAPATTKPVFHRGRLWMALAAHAQQVPTAAGTTDVWTTSLAAIEASETDLDVRHVATVGRLRTQFDVNNLQAAPSLAFNDGTGEFDVPARIFVDVGRNLRFGADWTRVDTSAYASGSHQHVDCVGAVAFSGSAPAWYDGRDVTELGYLNDPQIVSVVQAAGAGAMAVGTYDFFALYEYQDEAGNLHRSAPSAPFRAVVGGVNTACTVNVATTGLTGRLASRVLVHVFRTLAGPGPDIFRLTSVATAPRNDPTSATSTVAFVATLSDASVGALGLGFLYSGAETPARTPPAASAFLAHRGRAWIANADAPGSVFYSKPIRSGGLAPEFADEFEVVLPQASGPVTALAALDAAVVAFTETQVFVITGEGRAANAQGGDFSADLIPGEHGCINAASVVSTDAGAFFRSARGVCLVGRDQSVTYAGAAVEELAQTFPIVRSVEVDQERRRVLWLCRSAEGAAALHTILVFDLDMKVWSNWVLPALVTGHTVASGDHWVSTLDRAFGRESGSNARDFGTDYVTAILETPWLRVGALTGHQRTRRWALAAERPDPCVLTVEIFIDLNDASAAETLTINLGAGTRVEQPSIPRLSFPVAAQKHSAIKLRFADSQAAGDTTSFARGLDYAALSLDIAGKRGLQKVAAGNRS